MAFMQLTGGSQQLRFGGLSPPLASCCATCWKIFPTWFASRLRREIHVYGELAGAAVNVRALRAHRALGSLDRAVEDDSEVEASLFEAPHKRTNLTAHLFVLSAFSFQNKLSSGCRSYL